jgi:type IV pilus assembly protein PilM
VACLPESKTFIKLIEVQKSPNALTDIIGNDIEKHVPLAINEIYYDWQVIEELADKYFVLIGAAPQNIVNQYTALLDDAKLSPIALEIEPIAIARCLLKEEGPDSKLATGINYGLVDIGAAHTCMTFYSKNTILFTVSMPISGEEITTKIAEALNLTREQAEKAKIICGLDEIRANGVIKKILADMIEKVVIKVREAIQYYENYFGQYGPLNQILFCGGGANIANLAKIINRQLSIEVKIADALNKINGDKDKFNKIFLEKHHLDSMAAKLNLSGKEKKLSIEQNSSATYATAIGLALRGIFIDEI